MVAVKEPEISNEESYTALRRDSIAHGWKCGNSWLRENDYGLHEMYLEGSPYERGYINGLLTQELFKQQEDAFVRQLNKLVPSSIYQFFLKVFVAWFNKDLEDNIPLEYKEEIYGVSKFASPDYNYIAAPYTRIMNYHAAHDIGHMMQNMNLVACSSFGLWNNYTPDSNLIIGRNFDFYAGDEFAQEKIILFIKPDSGYSLMMVTWGGMTGVTSGMNDQGLTVTLNAAPSILPSGTAAPVTIIAREILQHAATIDEAYAIACRYKSFVSESFMIGSANDNRAVIIEKTTDTTVLYSTEKDPKILCTNHFQSDAFWNEPVNQQQMADNPTLPRMNRLQQLLTEKKQYTETDVADVLRNRQGMNGMDVGMSNEYVLNQLVAHHAIIFSPKKRMVWVSSNPYQLGAFVVYDLNKIFSKEHHVLEQPYAYEPALTIAADSFLYSKDYQKYVFYKKIAQQLKESDYK
ncbi:MAG: hypothetical protein H7259_01355, partial [Cytophagales bacterium]|nr:hypothetical protein [Cytophaga sp.]